MLRKLTEKQRRFADEYIISGNATDAARKAGYSEASAGQIGMENLKKENIKQYIDDRLDKLKKDSIATQDEILQFLTAVMRGEETEQTLIDIGGGMQKITDIDINGSNRIRAAEALGKRYGMWTEKIEHLGDVPVVIKDDLEDGD